MLIYLLLATPDIKAPQMPVWISAVAFLLDFLPSSSKPFFMLEPVFLWKVKIWSSFNLSILLVDYYYLKNKISFFPPYSVNAYWAIMIK